MPEDILNIKLNPQPEEDDGEEEVVEEEEQEEEGEKQPKQEKSKKPAIDHSIPPRERIIQERDKLKFEAIIMGSMQRQAAGIIGDLLIREFENYPERADEWDYNEWTLVDFLQAFADKARKEVAGNGNQALFAGNTDDPNDPTMNILRGIIETKNKPKKESKPATTTPTTAKPTAKPQPKPETKPKKQFNDKQILLDLGL